LLTFLHVATTKYELLPAEVALFGQRAQGEVVLGIGTGRDVQIPLDFLAVGYF